MSLTDFAKTSRNGECSLKQFKVLGTTLRKGAVRACNDLMILGIVIAKLVVLDMFLNQEHSGDPLEWTGSERCSSASTQ